MKMSAGRRTHTLNAILVAVTMVALSACSTPNTSEKASLRYVVIGQGDVTSAQVEAVDGPGKLRVIALSNGSAEILKAMGLGPFLVGRDVASTEVALESVPVVTSGHQVIPEKIISLNPNLVLVDSATGPSTALDVLRKSGIRLAAISEAWTLTEISKKISAIGEAVGAPRTASRLNAEMEKLINEARAKSEVQPRIAFLYLRGTSSIYLMGGPGSGADSLIGAIGALDVGAKSLPHPFNSLTSEALVEANPDILLVMTKGLESVGGIDGLISLPGVAQTPAGKNRRVISVDDSLLLSFGPRTPSLLSNLSSAVSQVMNS
jgi:iron complex transport system substrate-binding protein